MIEKCKFEKKDWKQLELAVGGWIGEIHHVAGKQYEYLCFLQPMSMQEHRGNGHSKYMNVNQVPEKLKLDNVKFWRTHLKENFNWFVDRGLVWVE